MSQIVRNKKDFEKMFIPEPMTGNLVYKMVERFVITKDVLKLPLSSQVRIFNEWMDCMKERFAKSAENHKLIIDSSSNKCSHNP